jgi:hypothetical protein
MAAINGSVKSMVQVSAYPNCAPACEYVAIPLGSSSAAPVISPGPSAVATRRMVHFHPPIPVLRFEALNA